MDPTVCSPKKSRTTTEIPNELEDQAQEIHDPPAAKSQRKRKRGLYKAIVQQMEFYFGDANLTKSRFMQEAMAKDPWLDLEVFLKFNKLISMLEQSFARIDLEDLWTGLSKIQSDLLEIREQSDGKRQIRRKLPVKIKDNEDECTIYVENIPPNVSNDCLRKLFTQYDQVSYVSLPKFKNHEGNKGFAFVEFDTPEGVQKALEAFGAQEGVISNEKPPEELQSVKAFNQDEASSKETTKDPPEGKKDPEKVDMKEKKTKKKNRKRKREEAPEQVDVELKMMSLRIMSKREWKRLRNKYLNQQRENFKWAKKQLNKPVLNSHIKFQEENGRSQGEENGKPQIESSVTTDIEDSQQPESQFRLIPGTVVKFTLDTPIEDRTQVKRQVKSAFIDGVEYVDVQIGASEYHVRCNSPELAEKLAGVLCLGKGRVLEGQDEETYWSKMERERAEKRSGKIPKKTIRGRKKVLKKLDVAANSHKYFTDDWL